MRVVLIQSFGLLALVASASACGPGPTPPEDGSTATRASDPAAPPPPRALPAADQPAPAVSEDRQNASEGAQTAAAAQPATPSAKLETRTMEVIAARVAEHRQTVRDCFDIARQDEPDLQGTLTVHFELSPSGKVNSAELNTERSTLTQSKLVTCALTAFKQIPFPPSSRGFESVGNYPFDFRP